MKRTVLLTTIILLTFALRAEYFDKYHGFGMFAPYANAGKLLIENRSNDRHFICDTTDFSCGGDFEIRYSNIGNIGSECGIVWNFLDSLNYEALSLVCSDSAPYDDVLNTRTMIARRQRCHNGKLTNIGNYEIASGVNLTGGYNSVAVEFHRNKLSVKIGEDLLLPLLSEPSSNPIGKVGMFAGKNAKLEVASIYRDTDPDSKAPLLTAWTSDSIKSHLVASTDPIEGFYTYLDRKTDSRKIRLGGKYSIAVVRNDGMQRYDIVYLSGAKVNAPDWQPGTLKGRLVSTGFTNNYRLQWFDAENRVFDDDCQANFLLGTILELRFPAYDCILRFERIR